MNKAVPWRIKGVPFDARAAAIDAARRSGMSLGEWLNSVIAEQAAAEGTDEEDIDRDAELDAVTHRLMDLRDKTCEVDEDPATGARPVSARDRNRQAPRGRFQDYDQDEREIVRDARRGNAVRRPVPSEFDAEALLENAIAAFDRRANRSSERTARALAEVAELIDSSKRERTRGESTLSTIADRLSGLERTVAQAPVTPPRDPHIHDALARLEKRIESLAQPAVSSPPAAMPQTGAPMAAPSLASAAALPVMPAMPLARDSQRSSRSGRPDAVTTKHPLAAAIAEVARRQKELEAAQSANPFPAPPQAAAFVRPPQSEQNPLEARLAALVDRLERTAARKPEPPRAPDISGLQGNIDSLANRIETMRGEMAARNAAAARRGDGIEPIRRELTAMSRVVADLAPRASVAALEDAVRDLAARVRDSRSDGVGESALAPVEALTRELLAVARNSDPRAAIESLDRSIRAVSARLEAFDGAAVADPDLARGIAEQTREMRNTLAQILDNQLPAKKIERELANLGSRVDAIATAGADPLGRGALTQQVGEIRAMLADPGSHERTLQVLERRLDGIAGRLDSVFGERLDTLERRLSAELKQARDAVPAPGPGVETLVHDLGARLDQTLTGGLDTIERRLSTELRQARALAAVPASGVETLVHDLGARLDQTLSGSLDTMERRLAAFEEARATSAVPTPDVESLVQDLGARLDQALTGGFDTMERRLASEFENAWSTAAPTPGVETLVQDLGARIDQALTGGLQAMERTVARLVENAPPKTDAETTHLEMMVRELAARIDADAKPGAGSDALDAMQRQIARLTEHLDRSDKTSSTLIALEGSVAELFRRLELSHDDAIEMAQTTARKAAEDALRSGKAGPTTQVTQELSDIRSLQDAADHRTHATLTAVHDTLSQVVNRLTSLEDDLADVREASEPVPPPRPEPAVRRSNAPARTPEERPLTVRDFVADDADVLIEPGAKFARQGDASGKETSPEYRPQASFIQAARRAAQAAGASAEPPVEPARPRLAASRTEEGASGAALNSVRAYYASRKRPILLSLAALMMVFGAWQVARVMVEDRAAPPPTVQAPKVSALPSPREKQPSEKLSSERAVAPTGDVRLDASDAPARKADMPAPPIEPAPPAPSVAPAPAPSASIGAFDRMPVGSIARPEPTVDTNGIVRALALSGDAAAQYELATRYADGKQLARDSKLSTQWFEKAAAKGLVPAQYRLGAAYERGIGVSKDAGLAKQWYARAAEGGNARAMHNLAVLYADGSDGKANYADAITWFQRAAEFGVRDSQFNLAILYARGLGTPANMVEAYVWFAAAATQGDEDAAKKRDDVAGRLPANDLARAKALASAFKAKPLEAIANDVTPPPGGWESMQVPPRPDTKSTARPKMSNL